MQIKKQRYFEYLLGDIVQSILAMKRHIFSIKAYIVPQSQKFPAVTPLLSEKALVLILCLHFPNLKQSTPFDTLLRLEPKLFSLGRKKGKYKLFYLQLGDVDILHAHLNRMQEKKPPKNK